jgi:hypothetical protein
MVDLTGNSSYLGGGGSYSRPAQAKSCKTLSEKITKTKEWRGEGLKWWSAFQTSTRP